MKEIERLGGNERLTKLLKAMAVGSDSDAKANQNT